MYDDATLSTRNEPMAILLYEKVCAKGTGAPALIGCQLGQTLRTLRESGPVDSMYRDGQLREACDHGSLQSCFALGIRYRNGFEQARDENEAMRLFQLACRGGDALACLLVGDNYRKGEGTTKNPGKAIAPYEKACAAGIADGCSLLAFGYSQGFGVAKSASKAAALYQKACDAGQASACGILATIYAGGIGVAADNAKASALSKQACDGGYKQACGESDARMNDPIPAGESLGNFNLRLRLSH